jgi:hypothetical protein
LVIVADGKAEMFFWGGDIIVLLSGCVVLGPCDPGAKENEGKDKSAASV